MQVSTLEGGVLIISTNSALACVPVRISEGDEAYVLVRSTKGGMASESLSPSERSVASH